MLLKSSTANLSKSDIVFKSNFAHLFFITIPSNFSYVYREYTITSRESMHLNPVYPCAYREHYVHFWDAQRVPGLSLCIQGTSHIKPHNKKRERFIPVHTGNIPVLPQQFWMIPVYPCAYREHMPAQFRVVQTSGLSLCIQGTLNLPQFTKCTKRFIPVHTGNIIIPVVREITHPVYPCAYREHKNTPCKSPTGPGLSLCIQGTYQL